MFHYNSYPGYRWRVQMPSREIQIYFLKLLHNNYNNIQIWSKKFINWCGNIFLSLTFVSKLDSFTKLWSYCSQIDKSITKFLITQFNVWYLNTSWHLLNSYELHLLTQPYIDQNMLECKFIDFFDHI
jgi:hypothetical protein